MTEKPYAPRVIFGGKKRYEVQWLGASGNWWHESWHSGRRRALLKARIWWPSGARRRVIDHGSFRSAEGEQ